MIKTFLDWSNSAHQHELGEATNWVQSPAQWAASRVQRPAPGNTIQPQVGHDLQFAERSVQEILKNIAALSGRVKDPAILTPLKAVSGSLYALHNQIRTKMSQQAPPPGQTTRPAPQPVAQ